VIQGSHIEEIARVIQLSIGPVFLITGIAGLLGVLSGRLGRTIDRARVLHGIDFDESMREEIHGASSSWRRWSP